MGLYEFNREDAYRFASEQRIRTRERGDEIQFYDCPYCHGASAGDKWKFAISLRTGMFNCKRGKCSAKGNMITLSKDFDFSLGEQVDAYYRRGKRQYRTIPNHKPEPKESSIAYLARRGISEATARLYNITTHNMRDNILCFPFYDEDGILRFAKYRNMEYKKGDTGNKEWCEADCKPILFGMNHCNPEDGPLIITEGQIDSLSVAECGIPNAVSVPNGKNGFTWVPYCWDFMQRFGEIIIFGDCENGEITLLDEIYRRFRKDKAVKHVRIRDYLGHKDANEILQAEGKEAIEFAIKHAEPVHNPRIIRVADIERVDMSDIGGIDTGFAEIDSKIGQFYYGQLILITGERGHGKSTLAMQFGARAVNEGITTMFYSGELPNGMFQEWMERNFAGGNHITTLPYRDKAIIDPEVLPRIKEWYGDLLYLYDNYDVDDEEEQLLDTLRAAIIQKECKLLVIDNLMTAIEDDMTSDIYRQQTVFVKSLAKMAKEYKVIIILVAHPRKSNGSKGFSNDDVSGSANITNLCDIVIRYAKPDNEPDSPERILTIHKNRINGKTDNEGVRLYFEDASKRISDNPNNFDLGYGWEWTDGANSFASVEALDDIPF